VQQAATGTPAAVRTTVRRRRVASLPSCTRILAYTGVARDECMAQNMCPASMDEAPLKMFRTALLRTQTGRHCAAGRLPSSQ
jgi:hypothetical protein